MKNLCEEVHPPFATSVMTSAVSLVLCLITVPGNILICIAILKDPYRELCSSFNYFVLQLALSDVIVGIFTEPALCRVAYSRGPQLWCHGNNMDYPPYVFHLVHSLTS